MLPKKINIKQIERILMVVLGLFFVFWLLRQCAKNDDTEMMQPIATQQQTKEAAPKTTETPAANTSPTATTARRDTVVQTQYINRPTPLFVWVEGLKVRSEPYLSSSVVAELPLNTQVIFQNETSSFKQKIVLDKVEYDDRWLKIQTPDGKAGWVYGGGVRLYQK